MPSPPTSMTARSPSTSSSLPRIEAIIAGRPAARAPPPANAALLWCVCVMATASASAAWSGCGMRARPRMTLVISCTWILLARP